MHNHTPRHSALLTPQLSTYKTTYMCHVEQQQKLQHNDRFSTAHALHSFCIQDRPHLPCSEAIKLQPPTTWLLHLHLYAHVALPTPLPFTTLLCTQIANTRHSWKNGTRCRGVVKVLWCHSHLLWLVFEGSIPTCTCFCSENFFVTLWDMHDFWKIIGYNCNW